MDLVSAVVFRVAGFGIPLEAPDVGFNAVRVLILTRL
jgi:hypothetical protein